MAQINLAPGTQFIAAARRRRRALYLTGILLLLLVGVVWGGLYAWSGNLDEELQTQTVALEKLEAEITRAGETVDRIKAFESRLTALDALLDDHIDWAPVFAEIERLLPPATVITNLEVTNELQKISVQGNAPTVDAVAQTLASLRDTPARETLFSNIDVSGVSRVGVRDEAGVEIASQYSFEVEFAIK